MNIDIITSGMMSDSLGLITRGLEAWDLIPPVGPTTLEIIEVDSFITEGLQISSTLGSHATIASSLLNHVDDASLVTMGASLISFINGKSELSSRMLTTIKVDSMIHRECEREGDI